MLALKFFAAYIMSVAVGILYRIPRRIIPVSGLVGATAWLVFYTIMSMGGHLILADFVGGITVGLTSEVAARILRKPATIFVIPGFIPLVPGGDAYLTMLNMVGGHYFAGVTIGMRTLLSGGAIAFGLFISSTTYRLFINLSGERTQNAGQS